MATLIFYCEAQYKRHCFMLGLENISNDIALHHILHQLDSYVLAEYPSVQCRWFQCNANDSTTPMPISREGDLSIPSHAISIATYEGRSISDAPDPLPGVWFNWNFACIIIYISIGDILNSSSKLMVVYNLQVFWSESGE